MRVVHSQVLNQKGSHSRKPVHLLCKCLVYVCLYEIEDLLICSALAYVAIAIGERGKELGWNPSGRNVEDSLEEDFNALYGVSK